MARYTQRYECPAWKGTADDLGYVVDLAAADLQLWGPGATDFSATLALAGGREISLDDRAELRDAVDRNATSLIELTIRLDRAGDGSVEARLVSKPSMRGAVSFSVRGEDESRVHGLALRLGERVDEGRRREPVGRNALTTLAGCTALFLIASALFGRDADTVLLPVGQITGILVGTAIFSYEALVPPLELLRVGERSRLQRWGARVGATIAIASFILGIVALLLD